MMTGLKIAALLLAGGLIYAGGPVTSAAASPHGINCSGKRCVCTGVDACKKLKDKCAKKGGSWSGGWWRGEYPVGSCDF